MDKRVRMAIAELRRLEHAATPGPWSVFGNYIEDCRKIPVAKLAQEHLNANNADFIAGMRNTLDQLLEVIEQQDRELERLRSGRQTMPAAGPARPVLQ
jgi:hypothetical protein